MESLLNKIQPFISKDVEIVIEGEQDNLFVFDWNEMEKEHFEVISQVKGMTKEEISNFLSYNETSLMQITDHFLDEYSESKIEKKEWLPFGLLGLCHSPDSFAELCNNGILLFDLTKDQDNPAIILYRDTESQTIANHFSELQLTEAE